MVGTVVVDYDPGGTVSPGGERVASVFDVVRRNDGKTALWASKTKFNLFDRTWRIDRFKVIDNNHRLVSAMLSAWDRSGMPAFTFLHLSAPDAAGHASRFMSRPYLDAVKATDAEIMRILNFLDSRPSLVVDTGIIVTADHGGAPMRKRHDDASLLANYRIPFFVVGPGFAPGSSLYAAHAWPYTPGFTNPGRRQPGYEDPAPVRNGLLGNLACRMLGLRQIPRSQLRL